MVWYSACNSACWIPTARDAFVRLFCYWAVFPFGRQSGALPVVYKQVVSSARYRILRPDFFTHHTRVCLIQTRVEREASRYTIDRACVQPQQSISEMCKWRLTLNRTKEENENGYEEDRTGLLSWRS